MSSEEISAKKTAKPSPRSGVALPLGSPPKATGGKKGRSGRKPDEFKAYMQELVSRKQVSAALSRILNNPAHPDFLKAYKMAAEFAYGRATQAVEVSGTDGAPIAVTVTHRIIDPVAP